MSDQSSSSWRQIVATVLDMGQTRLELAGLELREAGHGAIQTVVLGVMLVMLLGFASLAAWMFVLVWLWHSWAMHVLAGCALFYVLCAVLCWFRLKAVLARTRESVFEATVAELAKDKAALSDAIRH